MKIDRNIIIAALVALFVGLGAGLTLAQLGGGASQAPFERIRSEQAARPQEIAPGEMQLVNVRVDTSGEQPRACLEFSRDLQADGSVRYADYVRIEPSARAEFSAAGKLLCIAGLPFEPERAVTLLSGLPAADGQSLAREESFTLSFGDRPSFVGFVGQGVILPRSEADGLGIETVNVSKLKIEVLRISPRNLARQGVEEGQNVPEGSYSYWDFNYAGSELGAPVYSGELDVGLGQPGLESRRNQTLTTVFPLGAALKRVEPGAYMVKVEDITPGAGATGDRDRPAAAYRTILYTDLALQTFRGAHGLDVVVRSLETAKPISGVKLTLLAQNHDELGSVKTDGQGRARFAAPLLAGEGALRPRAVLAYGSKGDFTALDLERSPIDLSERGVDGRQPPPEVDAFLYSERGIYRPGETVRLSGLIRDSEGRAVTNRKSLLIVRRPNGTEAKRQRLSEAAEAGAVIQDIAIARGAPRGRWTASLVVDGQDTPAGELAFTVEDFVPQKLKVELRADESPWNGEGVRALGLQANFLYGAVGAGLPVQGEARLVRDPDPFPNAKGFQFGLEGDAFEEQYITLEDTVTDGAGAASLALRLPSEPQTSLPLRAYVNAAVLEPGGRAVREGTAIPVRLSQRYFGLKPGFDGYAAQNTPISFAAVALDRAGRQVAHKGLAWTLIEEDYGYDWYLEGGQWRWRRTGRDIPLNTGSVDLGADAPVEIALGSLPSGSYRLEVEGAGSRSSHRFGVGWGGAASDRDTPDVVAVAPPTESVKPGGKVRLELKSPYAGEAQVIVATDRVLSSRTLRLTDKPATVELTAGKEWGAGAYVLVTVVTPRDPKLSPVPRRAVGVAYVPIDMGKRTLEVSLAPQLEKLRPADAVEVPIEVKGASGQVRLTLAAVDEGILQLTKFTPPDPAKYFYGRRALGVELRDDYGRLLDPNLGAPATPRQGGDGLGGEGLSVVPQKTVALWSGLVELKNGKGVVRLPAADLNGAVKLMAVAWTADAVGSASKSVIVRDPVVADLTLPRFLAPGDDAQATLLIDNVEGAAGEYTATLRGEAAARLDAPPIRVRLAAGEQRVVRAPISANGVGLGTVRLTLEGPGGYSIARSYPIEARAPFLPFTLSETNTQAANSAYLAKPALFEPFAAGAGEALISYSQLRGIDPAGLISSLERYPYGCTEQVVSVAMPLLFAESVKAASRDPQDSQVKARLQTAVNSLLDRQSPDGAFGLWRANDNAASPWIGAYAVDFLRRAKAAGLIVPAAPMESAYAALRAVARLDDFAPVSYDFEVYQWSGSNDSQELLRSRAAAYALYVLAKGGKVNLGQLRYFADAKLKNDPSPLARAQIGAALAHLGDRSRAKKAFAEAEKALGYENTGDWYQTPLRDLAGVLALASEAGEAELTGRLARRLEREAREPERLSTQEQTALLAAADALLAAAGPVAFSVDNGQAQAAPVLLTPASLTRPISFKNVAQGQLFRTVTRYGAPSVPPPAAQQGLSISKRLYRMNGAPADAASLRQGERIVVVLQGKPEGVRTHPALAVDLLPAGLEIESVLRPEDGRLANEWSGEVRDGAFGWVGAITSARVAEARDDRFVAAADLRDGNAFTFAYVARAVTPGAYALPGAQVEDMYRPGVFGRSAAGRISIAPQER